MIGKTIIDELTVAARGHQPGTPQLLEMLRGIGNRQAGPLRQRFDATLALGDMLKQIQPMGVP